MVKVRSAAAIVFLLLTACGSEPDALPAPPPAAVQYHLGAGDKLAMTVFGNTELSGSFTVDPEGNVDLPLIGSMAVGGQTVTQVRDRIRDRLNRDFIVNPRVTIEIANYRPFFILGEVNHRGNYPYSAELTVGQAVAVAGGFTRRARTDDVLTTRHEGDAVKIYSLSVNDPILPGDTIEIRRRSF